MPGLFSGVNFRARVIFFFWGGGLQYEAPSLIPCHVYCEYPPPHPWGINHLYATFFPAVLS